MKTIPFLAIMGCLSVVCFAGEDMVMLELQGVAADGTAAKRRNAVFKSNEETPRTFRIPLQFHRNAVDKNGSNIIKLIRFLPPNSKVGFLAPKENPEKVSAWELSYLIIKQAEGSSADGVLKGAERKTLPDRRFTPEDVNAIGKWHVSAQGEACVRFVVTIKLPKDEAAEARQVGQLTIRKEEVTICECDIFGERRVADGLIQFIFFVHEDYLANSRFRYVWSLQRGTQAGYIVLGDFAKKDRTPNRTDEPGNK